MEAPSAVQGRNEHDVAILFGHRHGWIHFDQLDAFGTQEVQVAGRRDKEELVCPCTRAVVLDLSSVRCFPPLLRITGRKLPDDSPGRFREAKAAIENRDQKALAELMDQNFNLRRRDRRRPASARPGVSPLVPVCPVRWNPEVHAVVWRTLGRRTLGRRKGDSFSRVDTFGRHFQCPGWVSASSSESWVWRCSFLRWDGCAMHSSPTCQSAGLVWIFEGDIQDSPRYSAPPDQQPPFFFFRVSVRAPVRCFPPNDRRRSLGVRK